MLILSTVTRTSIKIITLFLFLDRIFLDYWV